MPCTIPKFIFAFSFASFLCLTSICIYHLLCSMLNRMSLSMEEACRTDNSTCSTACDICERIVERVCLRCDRNGKCTNGIILLWLALSIYQSISLYITYLYYGDIGYDCLFCLQFDCNQTRIGFLNEFSDAFNDCTRLQSRLTLEATKCENCVSLANIPMKICSLVVEFRINCFRCHRHLQFVRFFLC